MTPCKTGGWSIVGVLPTHVGQLNETTRDRTIEELKVFRYKSKRGLNSLGLLDQNGFRDEKNRVVDKKKREVQYFL